MHFDDASKALVEFAASRHNAFHTSEAASIGINDRRLRRARARGEVHNLYPSVWAFSALSSSPHQRLRAATLAYPGAIATMASAAWLHRWLPHPPPLPQLWNTSRSRPPGNVTVQSGFGIDPHLDLTEVDRIPTLTPEATLCLLGNWANEDAVERCLDEFLRRGTTAALDLVVDRICSQRTRQPRGIRVLEGIRNHPKRISGVSESWLERVVARMVTIDGMPPLELQHQVEVEGRKFRLDIACPTLKLGIEAHSRTFHWGPDKADADNIRDLHLTSIGWEIIYVTHSQTLDPESFIYLFAKTARARARQLQVDLKVR